MIFPSGVRHGMVPCWKNQTYQSSMRVGGNTNPLSTSHYSGISAFSPQLTYMQNWIDVVLAPWGKDILFRHAKETMPYRKTLSCETHTYMQGAKVTMMQAVRRNPQFAGVSLGLGLGIGKVAYSANLAWPLYKSFEQSCTADIPQQSWHSVSRPLPCWISRAALVMTRKGTQGLGPPASLWQTMLETSAFLMLFVSDVARMKHQAKRI